MGVTVYLGNHQPKERVHVTDEHRENVLDEATGQWQYEERLIDGKQRTKFEPPADWDIAEIIATLKLTWGWHSNADSPQWVAATDPALAAILGAVFACPVREVDLDHDADSPANETQPTLYQPATPTETGA